MQICFKKSLINDICRNQPCQHGAEYCILKEIVLHDAKYSDRLLIQFACVNKFKYELSQELGEDVGWNGAWAKWVEAGFAAKFGKLYSGETSFETIYAKIMAEKS